VGVLNYVISKSVCRSCAEVAGSYLFRAATTICSWRQTVGVGLPAVYCLVPRVEVAVTDQQEATFMYSQAVFTASSQRGPLFKVFLFCIIY
jgi:hypothetical protein